jgi:hypothetical protein
MYATHIIHYRYTTTAIGLKAKRADQHESHWKQFKFSKFLLSSIIVPCYGNTNNEAWTGMSSSLVWYAFDTKELSTVSVIIASVTYVKNIWRSMKIKRHDMSIETNIYTYIYIDIYIYLNISITYQLHQNNAWKIHRREPRLFFVFF